MSIFKVKNTRAVRPKMPEISIVSMIVNLQ